MKLRGREDLRLLLIERGLLGYAAEIGVAEARTGLELLQWGFQRVYLIDLWASVSGIENLRICREKVKPFGHRAVFLQGWSHEMTQHVADNSLDLLHIDASHDYKNAKRDLLCWYPKVRSGVGAIVSLHDYSNPELGVKQAVDEFASSFNITRLYVMPGGCAVDATVCFEKE